MTARERTIIRCCQQALQGSQMAQKLVDSYNNMYAVQWRTSYSVKDRVALLLQAVLEDAK